MRRRDAARPKRTGDGKEKVCVMDAHILSIVSVVGCAAMASLARAGSSCPPAQVLKLWPGAPPGPAGDPTFGEPSLTAYLPAPEKATGTAAIICPGGGYRALMETYEGRDVAAWLADHGVAGIVLRYRVNARHPAPWLDGQRAVRVVRAHAHAWRLDPGRIGLTGFSAGGHLAATVGTHFDSGNRSAADAIERESSRPDFLVLIYPVITLGEPTHAGSREALLGPNPDPEAVHFLSNERHVSPRTPPTFLAHARTDTVVPVANSRLFHAALRAQGVPAELLELPEGEHGLGCGHGPLWQAWQDACLRWMAARGLLSSGSR